MIKYCIRCGDICKCHKTAHLYYYSCDCNDLKIYEDGIYGTYYCFYIVTTHDHKPMFQQIILNDIIIKINGNDVSNSDKLTIEKIIKGLTSPYDCKIVPYLQLNIYKDVSNMNEKELRKFISRIESGQHLQ